MPRRSAEERLAAAMESERKAKERRRKAQDAIRSIERANEKRRSDLIGRIVRAALAQDDEEGRRLRAWIGDRFEAIPDKELRPDDRKLMSAYIEEATRRNEQRKGVRNDGAGASNDDEPSGR